MMATAAPASMHQLVRKMPPARLKWLLRQGCQHRVVAMRLKSANRDLTAALRRFIGAETHLSYTSNRLPDETIQEYRRRWPEVDPVGFSLVSAGLDAIQRSAARTSSSSPSLNGGRLTTGPSLSSSEVHA